MSDQKTEKNSFDEIKNQYLKSFDDWLSNSGINPVIGKLMQFLRTEDRPVTQGEMKHALNLSKATISRNLKAMEQMNLLKIIEITPIQIIGDKYRYELIDNSLYYIITTFIRRIYDSFKQRNEESKLILDKIKVFNKNHTNKDEIEKLTRIIKEETIVFDVMFGKFEIMLKEMENDLLNHKNLANEI